MFPPNQDAAQMAYKVFLFNGECKVGRNKFCYFYFGFHISSHSLNEIAEKAADVQKSLRFTVNSRKVGIFR
jgi:hypothetical protein